MGYLVQRKNRFYAVVYDGRDPLTGRERRTWHAAGRNREAMGADAANRFARLVTSNVAAAGGR